jgi:hypothetical protein
VQSAASFIPEVWSKKLLARYWAEAVAMGVCNTDYQGEIAGAGSKVQIRKAPMVSIQNYDPTDPTALLTYEQLKEELNELVIDQAKAWAFQVDDVLVAQSDLSLVNDTTKNAADGLVQFIDQHVLGSMFADAATQVGSIAAPVIVTQGATAGGLTNVLELIVEQFSVACNEKKLPREGRFIVVPSWMGARLKLSELRNVSITGDGSSPLRNGMIGEIDKVQIYESNNLAIVDHLGVYKGEDTAGKMPWDVGYDPDSLATYNALANPERYKVIGGTRDFFSFATQYVKTEDARIQGRFGQAIQGLQVYGMKALQPDAGVAITVAKAADA